MAEITNGKGKAATPFMTASGADAGAVWQSNRDDSAPAGLIAGQGQAAAKAKTVKACPTSSSRS
jgi:bifunctional non-homologous end joining protein LigD